MKQLLISPSKIYSFNECPKKLEFRYVLNIPWDYHDYFEIWKNVEAYLWNILIMKEKYEQGTMTDQEIKLAEAIYNSSKFQDLIKDKELIYQRHYKTDEIEWYSDIETDEIIIDIKTSATSWNDWTIEKYKYQAKLYMRESGKKTFYFVIANKKNYAVQVIKITSKNFDDLNAKIQEVKLAFELWAFSKNEWPNCFRCDYKNICLKNN